MTTTTARALKRPPTFTHDERGQPIAIVPLANGHSARLDRCDWESLLQRGITGNWTFNEVGKGHAYVRAKALGKKLVMIAREILGARPGEIVGYRNGDRTDLRRSNLLLSRGGRAKPRP